MKKVTSIFLTLTFVFSLMLPVHADSVPYDDPYSSNFSEDILIDGELYSFKYSLTSSGERMTIVSDSNGHTDVVRTNDSGTEIYLNDILSASTQSNSLGSSLVSSGDGWSTPVAHKQYISWLEGASVGTVAAVVGTAMGAPVSLVIVGCGAFYGFCAGGTLYWETQYNIDNGFDPKLKTTWSFTASTKDVYGPYSFIITR